MKKGDFHCCYVDSLDQQCARQPEWAIYRQGGLPYDPFDYTHTCDDHVVPLLYSGPDGSVIYPIDTECEVRDEQLPA